MWQRAATPSGALAKDLQPCSHWWASLWYLEARRSFPIESNYAFRPPHPESNTEEMEPLKAFGNIHPSRVYICGSMAAHSFSKRLSPSLFFRLVHRSCYYFDRSMIIIWTTKIYDAGASEGCTCISGSCRTILFIECPYELLISSIVMQPKHVRCHSGVELIWFDTRHL